PPDQLAADVEAEAGAADGSGRARDAVELLEDPFLLGARNADARIANGDTKVISTGLESDLDTACAVRVLDCVADEVREHLPKLVAIRGDRLERGWCYELDRDLVRGVHARGFDH